MRAPGDRAVFWAAICGALAFAVYNVSTAGPSPYDHYGRLARAFLQGRVDLEDPPAHLEVARFGGRSYVLNPPFPAVLLLPAALFWPSEQTQWIASHLVGALYAALTVLVAARLLPDRRDYLWVGALGACGTILWYLAAVGSTWYYAHVVVAAVLTVGILEVLGRRRPVVLGTVVAVAYLSRAPNIMTYVFFLLATLPAWAPAGLRAWRRIDLAYLIRLTAPVAAGLLVGMIYNWLRFGTIADIGESLRPGIWDEPWFARGLLHPSYIPRHLDLLFRALPVFVSHPPFVLVPWWGLAIWVTTPAFVYALRAPLDLQTLSAWLTVAIVALLNFLWGGTGWSQFGYRFISDIYPLLVLLTVRGLRGRVGWPARVLIGASVLVNLWGVVFIRLGYWAR
ncbi:MAG: hypothetical protein QN187_03010 [Armatimonadota bacterium]|nr:hypothetical protein [Armatimonadota bacterium]MDR7520316.1 hypothetical protein [Armatimonadota bacterium]